MISTDYVPEWYISPFQHVQYTLARNQLHMDLLFEDMGESEPSVEFEAYSIQAIAQDLFEMYEESEVKHGMEGEKAY
ncbi:hypothetical protein NRA43_17205 [Acinetobacter baumannii]|nr:hypothetical protein [Acinetobacter baumannii]